MKFAAVPFGLRGAGFFAFALGVLANSFSPPRAG